MIASIFCDENPWRYNSAIAGAIAMCRARHGTLMAISTRLLYRFHLHRELQKSGDEVPNPCGLVDKIIVDSQ